MSELHVIDHPLIADKLTAMRRPEASSAEFRMHLRALTTLMAYEVTRDFATRPVEFATPVATGTFPVLAEPAVIIVPILRAGIGMVDGMLDVLPQARVGHIGMARDEKTHEPDEYYCKLPEGIEAAPVIVVDPMLATGGSAIDAVSNLKERGCRRIRMMNLVAAPEGIAAFQAAHPDVDIYVAAVDERLNEDAYIVPGLGDAGDRIFGTV